MARLFRASRRSFCSGPELDSLRLELEGLRAAAREHAATKAAQQATADKCVEKLFELSNALDATDEQHNDDSLLHTMLFRMA